MTVLRFWTGGRGGWGHHQTSPASLQTDSTKTPNSHSLTSQGQWSAHRVEALDKISFSKCLQDVGTDPCHDPHAGHHVGRVGQLDSDLGQWRSHWPHAVWDDKHGAACNTTEEHVSSGSVALALHLKILGEGSINLSSSVLFWFLFKAEISLHAPIPLFWPGSVHGGSVS